MNIQIEIYPKIITGGLREFIIDLYDYHFGTDMIKSKQRILLSQGALKDAILNYQSVNKLMNENAQLQQKLKLMETELLRSKIQFPKRSINKNKRSRR